MLKISYAVCSGLSSAISVQFTLKLVSQRKIAKKSLKLFIFGI